MRRAPLPALALLAIAGCSGSLFKDTTPPPTLYMLSAARQSPSADPQAAASAAPNLSVLLPRVRAGLDTDRIAALYPDRRLDYYADVRWSGPLDEVLQDLEVQEFHAHSGLRNVSADRSVFASPYWLEIEVLAFQAEYSAPNTTPVVHVHLLARVGDSASRRVLGSYEPDVREAASDNRMSAIVDAYNRAAAKALAEIASGTVSTLGGR